MKKLTIFFVLCSSTLMAQEFKKELEGKFLPAKIIFAYRGAADDGTIFNVLMKYEAPEVITDPGSEFSISLSNNEAGATKYKSQTIQAITFEADNIIWARMPDPSPSMKSIMKGSDQTVLVKLTQQGAIAEFTVIHKDKLGSSSRGYLQKQGGEALNATLAYAEKQVREWMSDSPEIMNELRQADSLALIAKSDEEAKEQARQKQKDAPADKEVKEEKAAKPKGLLGKLEAMQKKEAEMKAAPVTLTTSTVNMPLILNNYSAWFDKQNPGKVKYYFLDPPVHKASPLEDFHSKQTAQTDYLKREKEKGDAKAAAKKKIDDLFVNRTETPSPENASAKDNVPVKKETFAAKLDRIKADGNKVGVILYLGPVRVNPPDATGNVSGANLTDYVQVEGEYMDESLKAAANEFVAELNQALNVSNIELIDINTIPYRQTKFGRLDDWWASKYKVVFAYTLDPRIRSSNEEIGGKTKFTASLNMIQSLIVREYIGGPGATKQDIITQVLNMGSFVTPTYAQDDQMTDVKAIYDKTLEKLAVPILSKIREERTDGVKKLVEKKLKP